MKLLLAIMLALALFWLPAFAADDPPAAATVAAKEADAPAKTLIQKFAGAGATAAKKTTAAAKTTTAAINDASDSLETFKGRVKVVKEGAETIDETLTPIAEGDGPWAEYAKAIKAVLAIFGAICVMILGFKIKKSAEAKAAAGPGPDMRP